MNQNQTREALSTETTVTARVPENGDSVAIGQNHHDLGKRSALRKRSV
jgi:hypothetical protein